MKFAEDAGVAELVGHGHRFHEAGDGLMVDGDFAAGGIGGDDFAAQGIGFELLRGFGRRLGTGLVMAAGQGRGQK